MAPTWAVPGLFVRASSNFLIGLVLALNDQLTLYPLGVLENIFLTAKLSKNQNIPIFVTSNEFFGSVILVKIGLKFF